MFQVGIKEVAILGIYAYVVFKVIKKGDMGKKAIATLVALYLLVGMEGFSLESTAATIKSDLKSAEKTVEKDVKGFMKASNINNNTVGKSPQDEVGGGMMGPKVPPMGSQMPYDGLCLKTGNQEYWMKSPDNMPFLSNDTLYTYLGSEGPVKMKISDQAALMGPPIDGVKGSPEKMFMLANNRSSLSCCPSTFSTSTGCICTTENQRDYVAERGGNN